MFSPGPAPLSSNPDVEALARYAVEELQRVGAAQQQVPYLQIAPQTQLPQRAENGMLAYFTAGVAGASEGFYGYEAGTWVKL